MTASIPDSSSARATSSTKPGVLELTARDVDGQARGRACRSCHVASWAHAVLRTHAPRSTIASVSSAIAMNAAGSRSPRSGCCQRTSASTDVMPPVWQVDDRLVVDDELAASDRAAQVRPQLRAPTSAAIRSAASYIR